MSIPWMAAVCAGLCSAVMCVAQEAERPRPHPAKQWSLQELFQRNVGSQKQQDTAFPPYKIIGNIYYVGTESLGSFLFVTPEGLILINTSYERTVPVIKGSVEKLGFKFSDIKIILGSHAHADHMEGDALAKEMTGAKVMAMAEDVPALEKMMPGGKVHPIDRVLHDGDTVTLGGTTLVAHLTPGHTKGCTTWTTKVADGGKTYDVAVIGSMGVNPGTKLTPELTGEYKRGFTVMRGLHVDVPLASHPAMYGMTEKYARLGKGLNPFVDPAGYAAELDIVEDVFLRTLDEQSAASGGK